MQSKQSVLHKADTYALWLPFRGAAEGCGVVPDLRQFSYFFALDAIDALRLYGVPFKGISVWNCPFHL
jgi:hypothetical protein